jgi:hypothetical protein
MNTHAPLADAPWISGDGLIDVLAACVRQALRDYATQYRDPRMPDAKAFLVAAGIVHPVTGAVDAHGHVLPDRRTYTKVSGGARSPDGRKT